MGPVDKTLYTARELHISIVRNMFTMGPFDVNYLYLRKEEPGDQVQLDDKGNYRAKKHYLADLTWREAKSEEIYNGVAPLLAFDNTVLHKIGETVRGLSDHRETDEAEALRRENEYLKAQNQELTKALIGVTERSVK